MSNLMCAAHLLATDPLFRTGERAEPSSALAQRGLSLNGAEVQALNRAWQVIANWVDGQDLPPIDEPNQPPWW